MTGRAGSWPKSAYEPAIDGLRAVAVVAVILNHLRSGILPSGYLGVDIFFVISGYVITGSLAERQSPGLSDFLLSFYARRIKRLVPALVLCVVVTSVLLCLVSSDPRGSLRTGLASLGGLSNLYLLRTETSYFGPATARNGFAQTWSLGVEEQFYLFFPCLVWLTGFGRRTAGDAVRLLSIVAVGSAASLIAFLLLGGTNERAAYYLMPARLWELGCGCLVWLGIRKIASVQRMAASVRPLPVMAGLIAVLFLPLQFAPYATIASVALTAVLLASLRPGTTAHDLLAHPYAVSVGQMSYSLYLWHWSVLTISRLTVGLRWAFVPFQSALMFLLAALSYRLVERPLRRAEWSATHGRSIGYGLSASVGAAVLLVVLDIPLNGRLFTGRHHEAAPIVCPPERAGSYWIAGDSHAAEFSKVVYLATSGNCSHQVATAEAGNGFLFQHEVIGTRKSDGRTMRSVRLLPAKPFVEVARTFRPRVVIVDFYALGFFSPESSAFESYDWVVTRHIAADGRDVSWREALEAQIENLRVFAREVSNATGVVVVLPEPEFDWIGAGGAIHGECNREWFNLWRFVPEFERICTAYLNPVSMARADLLARRQAIVSLLTAMQRASGNVFLYDTLPVLCDEARCSTHSPQGVRLFDDDDHIGANAVTALAPHFAAFLRGNGLLE